jgi:glycosyltransferase involved in cell wall biosynthesis
MLSPAAPGTTMGERPLRILMAAARYLPERGGTEIHTHEVAQRLAAAGWKVTVLSTTLERGLPRESTDGPVRVIRVRAWPPGRDYYLAPELLRVIRSGRVDLVHCQGYHTLFAPLVMLAALLARIPYVVTLHSGGHSSALRRLIRPLQAWILRPLLRRAQRLIAVSEFEAELFAHRLRLPHSAFVVIPSGVQLPITTDDPVPPGPPLVVSIGRLESYKGHGRVVEAMPALTRASPGIRLRILGSGSYESQLHRLADRLGVADAVEIAGVPAERRESLGRLLQQAAVVVALSEYESQGLAIQEALGLGRPVVVSDSSALAELTRHENVVALPKSADSDDVATAILQLLGAPAVEPPVLPTWDQCVAAVIEVYERALANTR